MASILFVAPADLGEMVLATGALAHLMQEGDTLTIVSRPDAATLLRAAPGLIACHELAADGDVPAHGRLWLQLARSRFDLIVDGHDGLFTRALFAARRISLQPAARAQHRVEDWAEAVSSDRPLAPKIWLDEAARSAAASLAQDAGPLLVLAPGGVVEAKRWPAERFAAIARRLAGGALERARVVVMGAAARDAQITRSVASSLDADGVPALDLGASGDLLVAAALMERATLCIGNDNALTHIAAAAGAPTLTLFGPTDENVRAPYGPRTRTLRGAPLAQISARSTLDGRAAMEELSIDAVEAATLELLHAGGLQ
jgi:lipopolysaccharide export system permease protein